MFINQIIPDKEGNVWVLLYNSKGLDKINPRTKQVTKLFSDELSGEKSPNYLLCDAEGMLWVGFHGGVMRILKTPVGKAFLSGTLIITRFCP